MSETIPPALTPDDGTVRDGEQCACGHGASMHGRSLYGEGVCACRTPGCSCARFVWPSGFTHADVLFLSEEAWLLLDEGAINARRRQMLDIANRIARLLPPEAP